MRFFIYFFRFFLLCILTGLVLTSLVVRWFAFGLDLKAKGGTLLSTNLQHVLIFWPKETVSPLKAQ